MAEDQEIVIREIAGDNIDVCKGLCNALMEHQAIVGRLHPEILRAMNFDNRLKPSFESAREKQLIVAFDGDTPVGYVFSTADIVTYASKTTRPEWAKNLPGVEKTGLYPERLPVPQLVGCLNNLYVLPNYRDRHIASTLCGKAMHWLRGLPSIKYIFVYISNGNESVIDFYKHLGFHYSHDVFGEFIHAFFQEV